MSFHTEWEEIQHVTAEVVDKSWNDGENSPEDIALLLSGDSVFAIQAEDTASLRDLAEAIVKACDEHDAKPKMEYSPEEGEPNFQREEGTLPWYPICERCGESMNKAVMVEPQWECPRVGHPNLILFAEDWPDYEEDVEPTMGNTDCLLTFDGYDTDGTVWFLCTVHGDSVMGNEAPCETGLDLSQPSRTEPS